MYKFIYYIILFFVTVSCIQQQKTKSYIIIIDNLFDTTHTITGYANSEEEFNNSVEKYRKEMAYLHQLFNSFESYPEINNIKTINDQAGVEPVKVEQEIIDLLKTAIKFNKEIDPSVNIAFGSVTTIWKEYTTQTLINSNNSSLPSLNILKEKNQCTDINNIIIDDINKTVFLKEKCMKLDVGAIAKGFAVELTTKKLIKDGVTSLAISAGGNVKTIGKRLVPKKDTDKKLLRCEKEFCIGIASPIFQNETLDKNNPYINYDKIARIVSTDTSVVTTGDYQRYFEINNQVYSHVIDPITLMPAKNFRAVTVITNDSALADYLSTTLFILSFEKGKKLVESLPHVDAIWMLYDGTIYTSSKLIEGDNYQSYIP